MKLIQSEILETFTYKEGNLFWRIKPRQGVHIEDKVGYTTKRGHTIVRYKKINYKLHQLIFLYFKGYLPKLLDHIDGNPSNNQIENLRECTPNQNQWNRKLSYNNTSGHKGLIFHKRSKKWGSAIYVNCKRIWLGTFITKEEAAKAYNQAAIHYFEEFAKLNEVSL